MGTGAELVRERKTSVFFPPSEILTSHYTPLHERLEQVNTSIVSVMFSINELWQAAVTTIFSYMYMRLREPRSEVTLSLETMGYIPKCDNALK